MKQARYPCVFPVIALIFLAVPSDGRSSNSNEGCNLCFRGKPKGKCCSFLILESGYLHRIAESGQTQGKAKFLITADVGVMFNFRESSAIGGSFHLGGDDNGSRFGIGPRYSKWLKEGNAVDISPYLLIGGSNNTLTYRFPGFAISSSLSIKGLFSLDAHFEAIPTDQNTQTGFYLGASGRSWGVLIMPLILIIAAASMGDAGSTF